MNQQRRYRQRVVSCADVHVHLNNSVPLCLEGDVDSNNEDYAGYIVYTQLCGLPHITTQMQCVISLSFRYMQNAFIVEDSS